MCKRNFKRRSVACLSATFDHHTIWKHSLWWCHNDADKYKTTKTTRNYSWAASFVSSQPLRHYCSARNWSSYWPVEAKTDMNILFERSRQSRSRMWGWAQRYTFTHLVNAPDQKRTEPWVTQWTVQPSNKAEMSFLPSTEHTKIASCDFLELRFAFLLHAGVICFFTAEDALMCG